MEVVCVVTCSGAEFEVLVVDDASPDGTAVAFQAAKDALGDDRFVGLD